MSDLLQALYAGDRDGVDRLLAADPKLDVFEAAAFGRSDRLRQLLDQDPSRANAFGDDGFHPLGLACFLGHLDGRHPRRSGGSRRRGDALRAGEARARTRS
jgi:hypothetical protein